MDDPIASTAAGNDLLEELRASVAAILTVGDLVPLVGGIAAAIAPQIRRLENLISGMSAEEAHAKMRREIDASLASKSGTDAAPPGRASGGGSSFEAVPPETGRSNDFSCGAVSRNFLQHEVERMFDAALRAPASDPARLLRYAPHEAGREYEPANVVAIDGRAWCAKRTTQETPGQGDDWAVAPGFD